MVANVLSQVEIDKLMQEVGLPTSPKLEPLEYPTTMYLKPQPRTVSYEEFSYSPPKRKTTGIQAICGCGKELKEVKIKIRNRNLVGFWCEKCNNNYSLEEVRSWRR